MRKRTLFIIFIVFIICISGCDLIDTSFSIDEQTGISVHFIDVGQGDSTLIMTPEGNMLIDGGDSEHQEGLVKYLTDNKIKKIDYIVATHPHSDHIGGLSKVIENFSIDNIIMPKITHTTKSFENLLKSISNKNLKPIVPSINDNYYLGNIKFTVLSPGDNKYENLNNYSIVLRMDYNDISFIFTGDAENEVEKELLVNNTNLKADVYKVSHHGSSTSSTKKFVNAINPKIAVISCGNDNSYNHPHKEVVELFTEKNIKILRTDEMGTIVLSSDGKDIFYNDELLLQKPSLNEISQPVEPQSMEPQFIDELGNGLIKGNINSKGERIYHMPNGVYYEQTKAEQYFKTEKEAEDNGFRKSSK